jgi:hypothetical protein
MLVIYYGKESAGDEFFKDFGEGGKEAYRAVGCGDVGMWGFARFKDEYNFGYYPFVWEVDEEK